MGTCISILNLMALRVSPSPEHCPYMQQFKRRRIGEPPRQIQLLGKDCLHSGSTADVHVGISQAPNVPGTLLAVKIIRDKPCNLPERLSEESIFEAYASRGRKLSHPNVDVILLASTKTDRSPYIVSKYYSRGSFLVDLKTRSRTDQQRLAMIKGLVNGLHYIHGQGIVHGHICEANLLCDDNGGVVICDAEFDDTFGLFASSCEVQAAIHRSYRHMPHERLISDDDAPLLPASKAADIYAIAVCITQMWTLDMPFARKNKFEVLIMLRKLRNLEIELERPTSVPAIVWANISDCFAVDPQDRPTAGELAERFEGCAVPSERKVGE